MFSGAEYIEYLKELCNVVSMCFLDGKVDNFRQSCMQLSEKHIIMSNLFHFFASQLEDQEINDFVNMFTPRLVFFIQYFELPFILEALPKVHFLSKEAFFTCLFDVAKVKIEDFSKFLAEMEKKKVVFETMISIGTEKQLKSLKTAAEKGQQEILERSISIFSLFNDLRVDDILFCRSFLSLYLLKQCPNDEKILTMNRILSDIGKALTLKRYYESAVHEISGLIPLQSTETNISSIADVKRIKKISHCYSDIY